MFRKRNRYVLKVELFYVQCPYIFNTMSFPEQLPLCLTVREVYLASSMNSGCSQFSTALQAQPFESGCCFIILASLVAPWVEEWNRHLIIMSHPVPLHFPSFNILYTFQFLY